MSTHTPGRLAVTHNNWEASTLYCEGGVVARVLIESDVDEHAQQHLESVKEDNARRLAACWNACEGIPTEELEPGEYGQHIIDTGLEIGKLTARRDELLDAMKRIESLSMSQFRSHQDMAAECQKIAFFAVLQTKGVAA